MSKSKLHYLLSLRTWHRWIRNRWQRTYELQHYPMYWWLQQFGLRMSFEIGKQYIILQEWLKKRSEEITIVGWILRLCITQIVLSFILLGALWWIESTLSWFFPSLSNLQIDTGIYTSLIATLAQIVGTFLGLYFTAISVVASTAYAKVPSDVRELIIQDSVGNQYIRLVALSGAISTIILFLNSLGLAPLILHLLLATIFGVVAILSFVPLAMRTFAFFDLTRLGPVLSLNLSKWIQAATFSRYFRQSNDFQAFYQRRAEELLKTFRDVVALSTHQDYEYLGGKAIVSLSKISLQLLLYYIQHKYRIPGDIAVLA